MNSTQQKSSSSKRPQAHIRQFVLALLLYAALLVFVIGLFISFPDLPLFAKLLLAFVPISVDLWVARLIVQIFRSMDELQQRVQLESLAIAFVLTAFVALTYGVLQLAGLPPLSWMWMVPVMSASWLAGLFISSRNYFRP
jgi:hypothetical protein